MLGKPINNRECLLGVVMTEDGYDLTYVVTSIGESRPRLLGTIAGVASSFVSQEYGIGSVLALNDLVRSLYELESFIEQPHVVVIPNSVLRSRGFSPTVLRPERASRLGVTIQNSIQAKPRKDLVTYPPYPVGILVYRSDQPPTTTLTPGKIIEYCGYSYSGDHSYLVSFNYDEMVFNHSDIIPTKDFFHHANPNNLFESKITDDGLINQGDIFLLVNGYLRNESDSLILDYEKYKSHFKKLHNDTLPKSSN